ncbi:MAG: FecR domain-containing protein [Segatella copri]|nr:FecR domain-containing protein [Segatella copri]
MDIYDIISRSLLHRLDEGEQQQLDQWLAEDEEHLRLYQSFLAKKDLVEQYHKYQAFDEEQGWKKLAPLLDKPAKLHLIYIWRRNLRKIAAVAAVGMFLLLGGYHLYTQPSQISHEPVKVNQEMVEAIAKAESSSVNEATIQVGNQKPQQVRSLSSWLKTLAKADVDDHLLSTITTRHDKEFWTTLPDGTRVHLNGNSRISYPLAFSGGTREVALVGEAYFIVAKDREHPFIVHTAQGAIKEYGTEFNVNTQGEHTSVVLVNGSISVIPKSGKERMMTPGLLAEMGSSGVSMSKVDVAPYIAWNTGQYSFEDSSLEEIMQVVGKWYGRNVTFASAPLRKIRLTGTLSRYESIESTLEVICTIAQVKMEQQGYQIEVH